MTADGQPQTEIINAWSLDHAEGSGDTYAQWVEFLLQPSSHRGTTRITVARFARRGGYRVFAEIGVGDEKTRLYPNSMVNFDARLLAKEAYEHAQIDHRRTATELYRLQTWHLPSKGTTEKPGDYATLRFGETSTPADDDRSIELGIFKLMRQLIQDGRTHNEKLLTAQTELVQASAATALFGAQLVEEMSRQRVELANQVAAMKRSASAGDINHRIDTVASKLEKPMTILAAAMAEKLRGGGPGVTFNTTAWPGAPGQSSSPPPSSPPPSSPAPSAPPPSSQAQAKAFFEGLDADQKDALRDVLSHEIFAAMVEVIHGSAEQWAEEFDEFAKILRSHAIQLTSILTPEQLQQAMEFA